MVTPGTTTTTTRMALRKREPPTTSLVLQRDALISRFTKRPRAEPKRYDEDEIETDEADSSDTESDYEERPKRKPVAAATTVAARGRATRADKPTNNVGACSTDKVLTFLQSAQLQNKPVRSGKWNKDEEAYLRKLVQLFNSGILDDVESKKSMRMWLAKMLHCCPMRISKKQTHGEKFKGKAKYLRNVVRIAHMGQKEFDRTWHELHTLRCNFLKFWAKEEFVRWGGAERSGDFGEWYDTVVRNVPVPRLAKNERLVEPKFTKSVEPWASVRKDLEATSVRHEQAAQERELQRRLLQRANAKERDLQRRLLKRTKANNRAQPTSSATEDPPTTPREEKCSEVSTLDLSNVPHEDIFEPIQSASLEVEVDLATLVNEWDGYGSTVDAPANASSEEHSHSANTRLSLLSPSIMLDFGPPSMWKNTDPISKDASSLNHCQLVDDLLSDDQLLALDPSMPTPGDLQSELWFQQLCTTFQL